MEMKLDNIFQMLEIGNKYALTKFKECVNHFIKNNISEILKIEQFQSLDQSVVKFVVELNHEFSNPEELFEAVYKWAENLALEKLVGDQSLTLNEEIKEYLLDILPFIKFKQMNYRFLLNYVGKFAVYKF
uniref:BACK domain-containing protein n=1 Tax=Panagrolaimus superbus TaxID=310955 RepID=A0A914YPF4_9BILA